MTVKSKYALIETSFVYKLAVDRRLVLEYTYFPAEDETRKTFFGLLTKIIHHQNRYVYGKNPDKYKFDKGSYYTIHEFEINNKKKNYIEIKNNLYSRYCVNVYYKNKNYETFTFYDLEKLDEFVSQFDNLNLEIGYEK